MPGEAARLVDEDGVQVVERVGEGTIIDELAGIPEGSRVVVTAPGDGAAVAAVAFFAIWSVLSNMFCALLIFTMGPFRIGDTVEVIESADKPGVKGRVIAINLFYTTLQDLSEEAVGAVLQVPNSLFFQKSVRRWR